MIITTKNINAPLVFVLALTVGHPTYAETFTIRAPMSDSISVWEDISTVEGDWTDVDGQRTCTSWSPTTSSVLLDESFIQSRDCEQLQEQEVTAEQEDSVSGETRTTTYTNERYVTETEVQDAIGTMSSWIFTDSEFTDWEYTGETEYSNWSPVSADQTTDYDQEGTYYIYKEQYEQQMQIYNSTGEIREYGSPILISSYDEEDAERSVTVTEGEWVYDGTYYDCGSWSDEDEDFETDETYYLHEKTCLWSNTRDWTHTSEDEVIYTYTEERTPSGTVYQYVQTYSCTSTASTEWGLQDIWDSCVERE
ncbi:hypothetical protein [Psychromonas sp. SP041]|uniref:hypothetical protein n=1 Tax=Psychromonas sp. SP041 TaxID=1365007 RepID=UPI0004701187|nr:hypothetical protein [Psychromonas sp. SP041]